jgi:beta-mannosidase
MQGRDLNGTWKLRWSDGTRGRLDYATREVTDDARYIDAQVPGDVHLDLWRAGWIADPYIGTNCLAARWVEECYWSYRKSFTVPEEVLQGRAWLCFEGLDLVATIVLNGVEIGRHQNAFYPCRIEVTGMLRAGPNLVTVHLESGLFATSDKPIAGLVPAADQRLNKRLWLRKPQFELGWDWSTRLLNVGIWKSVRLEWTTAAARVDQLVPLAELSADLQTGTVRARLFVEGLGRDECQGELIAELVDTGTRVSAPVQLAPGLHPYEVLLTLQHPDLWWPVGHGSPTLYQLRVTLVVDGTVVGEQTARIGFRYVRIDQSPHPVSGRYFTVEINNKPIFLKGANLVPADMIVARIDHDRYAALVGLALEAHFNCLRVWGGGLYESSQFYALCDEHGILVWQEFIFACGRYPTFDEAFHEDVKAEARYNIRRLAAHPSLFIWCGNNEIEVADWEWGFDKGVVLPDYALFHLTLPRLLAEEDPTRYYHPSSPFSPDRLHPNHDDAGDQHLWSVGFDNTDFRDYRSRGSRFPTEGGILGPTALPTMRACLPAGQDFIASFAWQVHDNAVDTWSEPSAPDQMISQWLGRDIRTMSIEKFTYWGGLIQGEGLREYCEAFRRRMFDSAGVMFWMYNDCWPATRSWTIVDYYLRRTPAFAPVRRALAPIHVVVAEEHEDVVVWGINETGTFLSADLRYGLFNIAGGLPIDRQMSVELAPNTATRIAAFKRSAWERPEASAAFATLSRSGQLLARNRLFLPFFKDLDWVPAELQMRLADGYAIFESPTFVWGVCLDLDGELPLPDNFFDVYPGIPYVLPWHHAHPPRVLYVGNLVV